MDAAEQPLGGLGEPGSAMTRLPPMEIILLLIGGLILAGVLFAVSNQIDGWGKRHDFVDKDMDGEPDEPNGPAKDL